MIDLEREKPVTLAEAAKLIPLANAGPGMEARKPPHPRTLYNWTSRGYRGVVLESVMLCGVLVTTREAIARFFHTLETVRNQRMFDKRESRETSHRRRSIRNDPRYQAVRDRLATEHGV